jgi:FtsZ-binding cell division protein ZapB
MPDKSSVNVQAISALEEMRAALLRFQSEAQSAVTTAQPEITATLNWLQERLRYWQNQLRARQEALSQAKNALARCLSLRGPNGERADCSSLSAAVGQAERKVQEAQEAIRIAQNHIKRVEEANANFQREAQRFHTTLASAELPKATALLQKSIAALQSYIGLQAPAGGSSGGGTASTSAASASSHDAGSSLLRDILFAPFSNSALKIAASVLAAGVITVSRVAWPIDIPGEIPGMSEPPAAIASVESHSPIRQAAKHINEFTDLAWDAIEQKERSQAEIKKAIEGGWHYDPPPEKP